MQMVDEKKQKWNNFMGLLLSLSLIAAIIKLFIGFDIDEAYAVSMPYRLLQGDHLFLDMWEVHQTSSFLPAAFIGIYQRFVPNLTGVVLYLRVIATIIHGGISLFLYFFFQKRIKQSYAFFIGILYFNFLPKWMMNLDFSMQQLWFFTLTLVCFYIAMYEAHKKTKWYLLTGISLSMAVLAYPGMVLIYPALMIQMVKNKSKINNYISFNCGCGLMAALFLGYVMMNMSVKQLLQAVPMVFSDGSHQYDFMTKLGVYLMQWKEVFTQSCVLIFPTLILTELVARYYHKKQDVLLFGIVFQLLSSAIVVFANICGLSWGPFRLQVRYLILFVLAILLSIGEYKKDSMIQKGFVVVLIPNLVMFVGILLSSNVGPISSASYLVLADIAYVILSAYISQKKYIDERKQSDANSFFIKMCQKSIVLFAISLILCKGYYVRVTEYAPSNILETRQAVTNGPVKGIFVTKEEKIRIEECYNTILQTTKEKEQILFMGTESVNNLSAVAKGARFVSPTTISTPAFNEQWVTYFENKPEKMPDHIFLAKNTVDNREKFFTKNEFGKWIAMYYDVENMTETQQLCVIDKKKA